MSKYLEFSIADTIGKTYKIPIEKAVELAEQVQKDVYGEEPLNSRDSKVLAELISMGDLEHIRDYEIDLDFRYVEVTEHNVGED